MTESAKKDATRAMTRIARERRATVLRDVVRLRWDFDRNPCKETYEALLEANLELLRMECMMVDIGTEGPTREAVGV